LEGELAFFHRLTGEIDQGLNSIYFLSTGYKEAKAQEAGIRHSYFSSFDCEKIVLFEANFKKLLGMVGFRSEPAGAIRASPRQYAPVYGIVGDNGSQKCWEHSTGKCGKCVAAIQIYIKKAICILCRSTL